MQIRAITKSIRISPRKVRLIADTVRNKSANYALRLLSLTKKRGSMPIQKTLQSAMANALNNAKVTGELMIKKIEISEGQALKRFHPSTRGRVHPYKKRSSHIEIILEEVSNGTKN
ncbi:50S ribosomal protein L22 [Candidatus Levyibacteriota bacterium]|nr:50S ribosomal protein L22 [Candidatus Levybacteria bacterium]GDX62358.1 50S ribosomal protein L22 [Candidatus Levybacteria bacterium]